MKPEVGSLAALMLVQVAFAIGSQAWAADPTPAPRSAVPVARPRAAAPT